MLVLALTSVTLLKISICVSVVFGHGLTIFCLLLP